MVHLENMRTAFAVTANPFFVWQAIHWCRNERPQTDVPEWCLEHLGQVASRINSLGHVDAVGLIGKGRGRAPETPTPAEMLRALGFISQGRNAFRNAGSQMRKVRAAGRFEAMRSAGTPYKAAFEEVMDWLGEPNETRAKTIIRTGKRILGSKT